MDAILNPFKEGMIILWFGTAATIPKGWALCNGANGTPTLTDRFIVGAGATYNPFAIGGAVSHNHEVDGGEHAHEVEEGTGVGAGTDFAETTSPETVTVDTDTKNHMPPYYALCYIMKL